MVHDLSIPEPGPDEMLCSVAAVALNPIDAKIIDYSPVPGVGGYDFSGTVVKIGENVKRFQPGDRVFGFTFGLNPDNLASGSFSNLVLATEDLSCHVPESLSFDQAATLSVPLGTAGYALYMQLGLPMPGTGTSEASFVLVSGGATSTGRIAIQLLSL